MMVWQQIFLFFGITTSVVSSVISSSSSSDLYPQLTQILQEGVIAKTYPGAVAIIGNPEGILFSTSVGSYSYDEVVIDSARNMKVDVKKTRYDIASLTKVISTTSAIAILFQSGYLNLDDKIIKFLGNKFSSHHKDQIEIQHCLLHNAGFSPDPVPWYWEEEFGCPNTDDLPSPNEDFSCLYPLIYQSLLNESLNSLPGEAYVYSDLSFLTLQMVVGTVVLREKLITRNDYRNECQRWIENHPYPHSSSSEKEEKLVPMDVVCAYEAFVRKEVFQFKYLDLPPSRSAPPPYSSSSP
jgi:CubicO group peptidase (beta-lactamase class C family)